MSLLMPDAVTAAVYLDIGRSSKERCDVQRPAWHEAAQYVAVVIWLRHRHIVDETVLIVESHACGKEQLMTSTRCSLQALSDAELGP